MSYEQCCEVENASNTRPLTYLSPDNHEEELTPCHLVYGRNINVDRQFSGLLSDPVTPDKLSSRALYARTVITHFMRRFQEEYITNLREFHRHRASGNAVDLEVGDLVLIKEESPRMMWRKACVTKLIKGTDGVIRGTELRTRQKGGSAPITLRRPVQY